MVAMPARRSPGTGSLRQRGDRWISQSRHPVSGRIVSRTHPVGTTERQAERLHIEFLGELAAQDVHAGRERLGPFVGLWLAGRDDVSPGTLASLRRTLAIAVRELGADRRVADIDVQAVTAMLVELRRRYAPGTVGNVRSSLSSLLRDAEAWGVIARNPVPLARRQRARTQSRTVVPSVADVQRVCAAEPDAMWAALWVTLAGTGMRPGEALALAWRHVDLEAATITVERTVTDAAGGGKTIGEATKTRRARVVPVGDDVVAALRAWRLEAATTGLWRVRPDELLWPSVGDPHKAVSARGVSAAWHAACERVGVGHVAIGSLRHLHASTLMAAGTPPQQVAERLGHSIQQTMQRYGVHVPDERRRDVLHHLPRFGAESAGR
jgi:integrase